MPQSPKNFFSSVLKIISVQSSFTTLEEWKVLHINSLQTEWRYQSNKGNSSRNATFWPSFSQTRMWSIASARSHWVNNFRLGMSSLLYWKKVWVSPKKKRLVIDYQPLNAFLRDEKFPLPKIQSLFVHLQDARIFSKFDLKAGFWQLDISPSDRPKTAFCIPNAYN